MIILFLGATKIEYSIKSIKEGLDQKFKLKIPINTVDSVLIRLKNEKLIDILGPKYKISEKFSNKDIFKLKNVHEYADSVFLCIKDELWALDVDAINGLLNIKFKIKIDRDVLQHILNHLVESEYIESTGRRHRLSAEGIKYYSEMSNRTKEIRDNLVPLLEDLRDYINRELQTNYKIEEVEDLLLSFIHKNIEPLADFLETSAIGDIKNYDINMEQERYLCEYVKDKIKNRDKEFYNQMKDLILGSTVSSLYNSEGLEIDNDKLKEVKIFLDTNILFYLLGYNFSEFTVPTSELYELMKRKGYRFYLFDFTLAEAERVLRNCISQFDKFFIPGIKVNSVCYYLKMKYKTLPRLQMLTNHLQDEINNKGIIIEPTNVDINNVSYSQAIRKSLEKYKEGQPPISQTHDLLAIDKIREIRNKLVFKMDESKAIFLTADQGLFNYNYLEMNHKESQTIPEVFVDRLLTNILWLIDPASYVSLESLIATCSRDVYIKRNVWDVICNRLEYLHDIKKIDLNDIFSIVYLDSMKSFFDDLKIQELQKIEKSKDKANLEKKQNKLLIKKIDNKLQEGIAKGGEQKEKLLIDIKEKTAENQELQDDLEVKNNLLNTFADQLRVAQMAEINKLRLDKSKKKEEERKRQNRLKTTSELLSISLIILVVAIPATYTLYLGHSKGDYTLFGIFVGIIAIIAFTDYIIDHIPGGSRYYWKNYWGPIEYKIYGLIRRNNFGLIITLPLYKNHF